MDYDSMIEVIWKKKFVFLGTFFAVFTFSYLVLLAVDFLPEPLVETDDTIIDTNLDEFEGVDEQRGEDFGSSIPESEEEVVTIVEPNTPAVPLTITIERLGKTVTVLNPTSRSITDLDTALLDGVVRHPDSATLGQDGNVFILGHSSYLPSVFNKNFQAFNGIQNLEWGDIIEVTSVDAVYKYRVEKVYKAIAQDLTVPIAGTEKMLTLATCNSFGSVDDRYIVEAKQVVVKAL